MLDGEFGIRCLSIIIFSLTVMIIFRVELLAFLSFLLRPVGLGEEAFSTEFRVQAQTFSNNKGHAAFVCVSTFTLLTGVWP